MSIPGPPSARSSFRSARGFASLLGAIVSIWLLMKAFQLYSLPVPGAAGPASLDGYEKASYNPDKQGLGFSYTLSPEELEQELDILKEKLALRPTPSSASTSSSLSSSSRSSSRSSSSSASAKSSSTSSRSVPTISTSTSSESPVSYPSLTTSSTSTKSPVSTIPTSAAKSSDTLDLLLYGTRTDVAPAAETSPYLVDSFEIVQDMEHSDSAAGEPENHYDYTTTIVVGRLDKDPAGVKWMHDTLRDITKKAIYIVDDPNAPLHLDRNKGREAMVYLKYIIEHYDKLSDVTIFFHSSRMAWHNNVLFNKDGAIMVNNLRRRHVIENGYFNMRCELYPGCPRWIKFNPTKEQNNWFPERTADLFSVKLWDHIFPNRTRDPEYLAQPCCSQFALSRDKIRSVPLAQYEVLRDWLFDTDIGDGYSGRIMEYVWQYLWLDEEEHCPSMTECYCKGYGLCLENDKSQKLLRYNELRQQMDEQMATFGNWDREHCKKFPEGPEKRKCKDGNPFVPPFLSTRREKGQLENSLAGEMGITEP